MSLYEKDLAFIHENNSVEIIPQSFPDMKHVGKVVQIGREMNERVVFKGAFFIKSEFAKGSFGHGHAH